jgi:phosphatidylethanolamine-binding protein (PEBP) family uncharacterized protein
MRKLILVAAAIFCMSASASAQTLAITSPEFKAGGVIPSKFTCDAGNTAPNPALMFSGVPAKTQSLALIMDDPDVPKTMIPSGEFVHSPPDKSHRYFFKLYALDSKLAGPFKNKAELVKAMEGHIIEQAELMANYERVKK